MQNHLIRQAINSGVPVLIWGAPGVGKTAAVRRLAQMEGYHLEVVLASIREPADFLGLPVISESQTRFVAPDWAQRLAQSERGLLFLDEISTAPPAVQAALLRVVLDRVVGDLQLPPTTRIVAAANPPELAAGGWELSPPLANRFVHINWELDAREWAREFPSYWGAPPQLPEIDEGAWAHARTLVASFIMRKPSLLLQVPASGAEAGMAWPSPRSWDNASRLLAVTLQAGGDIKDALPLVSGCVGQGAATEFIVWAAEFDLPAPEVVLAAADSFPIPQRGDIAFAIYQACAQYAVRSGDAQTWLACAKLLARAAEAGHADVAAVAFSQLARHRVDVPVPPEVVRPFTRLLKEVGV